MKSILIILFINLSFFSGISSNHLTYGNSYFSLFCDVSSNQKVSIYVYDYEDIFTSKEEEELTKIIISNKESTNKEIIIITTPSIGNFNNLRDYANNLGSIYSQEIKKEDVITFVMSKNIKEIAIATSPKAREVLTDELVENVINKEIIKEMKKNNLYCGIKTGLNSIIEKWNR